MYEELVKRLRLCCSVGNDLSPYKYRRKLMKEAADAIEELSKQVESLEAMREITPEVEYAIDHYAENLISHMEELISELQEKSRSPEPPKEEE